MIFTVLKLKNELLTEALLFYLKKNFVFDLKVFSYKQILNDNARQILTYPKCIVFFDLPSLIENPLEELSNIKRVLIDYGLQKQELAFLLKYYKLSGILPVSFPPTKIIDFIKEILNNNHELVNEAKLGKFEFFTQKEKKIIKLICLQGLSNKEIANLLSLSEQTVKGHLNRIFKKTGLKNRTQLVILFNKLHQVEDLNASKKLVLKIKRQTEN